AEREGARRGQRERARERQLLVGPRWELRAPRPCEQDREAMLTRMGSRRGQQVGRQADYLVDVHLADADLGETDRAQPDVAVARARVRGVHVDLERADDTPAEVDALPGRSARCVG